MITGTVIARRGRTLPQVRSRDSKLHSSELTVVASLELCWQSSPMSPTTAHGYYKTDSFGPLDYQYESLTTATTYGKSM